MNVSKLTVDEKIHLIKRNLQEVLGEDKIRKILQERDLHIYWGTATTGRPHLGYCVPLTKICDFLRAGCRVTILIADLHGYLDNMKSPWNMLEYRSEYYERIIKATLRSIGKRLGMVDIIKNLKFVKGTDFQLSKEYTLDVYRLSSIVTEHDAKKAGTEVVKQSESPVLSSLLYPGLQALDEIYLKVDAQFGGVDQRKIFTFAEKYMPLIGYTKQSHLMNPMVPGINGGKMSSSDHDSKIDILDSLATIKRKIKKSFCEPGNVKTNGLLSFVKYVLMPVHPCHLFSLKNREGTVVNYESYEKLENDFSIQMVHPGDLKSSVTSAINEILDPIRKEMLTDEMNKIINLAYPKLEITKKEPAVIAIDPTLLDIRVGKIEQIECPPGVDALYLLKVNFGQVVKSIVTNIRNKYSEKSLLGQNVAFLCNMKPTKFKGIISDGMILTCKGTSDQDYGLIVLNNTAPGEKVYFDSFKSTNDPAILQPKKKLWEKIITKFKEQDGQIVYEDQVMKSTCELATMI